MAKFWLAFFLTYNASNVAVGKPMDFETEAKCKIAVELHYAEPNAAQTKCTEHTREFIDTVIMVQFANVIWSRADRPVRLAVVR